MNALAPLPITANPGYRVQIAALPIVIDEKGEPISDAFVVAIRFRREMTATSAGHVPVVTGAGIAKILVGNTLIRGVPLAEWEDKHARWTAQ